MSWKYWALPSLIVLAVSVTGLLILSVEPNICNKDYPKSVRPPVEYTQDIKRELAAEMGVDYRQYRLDHTIPIGLGGEPKDRANLKLVPREVWASYTPHEIRLRKEMCSGAITQSEAQDEIKLIKGVK